MEKTNILPTAIEGVPSHIELPEGSGGMTQFTKDGSVVSIHTPPNPLIRVHELMHALHTKPKNRLSGRHPFVQQIIEDIRLHSHHWPFKRTPEVIAEPSLAMLAEEQTNIAKSLDKTERGISFGLALRDYVCAAKINNGVAKYTVRPSWFSHAESSIADQILEAISSNQCDLAARLYEEAFFPDESKKEEEKKEEEKRKKDEAKKKADAEKEKAEKEKADSDEEEDTDSEDGEEEGEDSEEEGEEGDPDDSDSEDDSDTGKDRDGPIPTPVITMDDKGPFTELCGKDSEGYAVTTSGPRIYRPALRRPILPNRMFQRRRAVQPGGTIIIDASGSMGMSVEDIMHLCLSLPQATVALYSGNDRPSTPTGTIYVVAFEGYRRTEEEIREYVENRPHGNTIDLEAIGWLMDRDGPRVMITDRGFVGSYTSTAALVRLEELERQGELTAIKDWREVLPQEEEAA